MAGAQKEETIKGKAPSKTKFKRIMELGAERKALLDSMFFDKTPVSEIIEIMQKGWGVFTDMKEGTLTKFLYRYKWDVIDKGIVVRSDEITQARKADILAEVEGQIDVVNEMAQLVVAQRARVIKLASREQTMPMLFTSLGGEMKTLAGFLQQYAELSFDLGLMRRIPKVTKVSQLNDMTLIESDGKEQVALSVARSKQLEEAAQDFFKVLQGADEDAQSLT